MTVIDHHPLLSTHRYSYAQASPNNRESPPASPSTQQNPVKRSTCRYAEDYKSPSSPSSQPRNPVQQPRTPTRKKTQYHSVRAIDKILRQDASNQKRPPRVTTIPSWTLPLPSVALAESPVEITRASWQSQEPWYGADTSYDTCTSDQPEISIADSCTISIADSCTTTTDSCTTSLCTGLTGFSYETSICDSDIDIRDTGYIPGTSYIADTTWDMSGLSAASLLADKPASGTRSKPCAKVSLVNLANLDEWWVFVARESTSRTMAESQDSALITLESELRTQQHLLPKPTQRPSNQPIDHRFHQRAFYFSTNRPVSKLGCLYSGSLVRRRAVEYTDLPTDVTDRLLKMVPVEWVYQLATIACSQSPVSLVEWIGELKKIVLRKNSVLGDHASRAKAESINPEQPKKSLQLLWEISPFSVMTAILL